MMSTARGLKAGDLVTVPASYRVHGRERREAVIETVSLNGLWFIDTTGVHHHIADTELVPVDGAKAGLARSEALGLADKLSAAATEAADPDTAGTLLDLVADLINHANGHPVPWLTRP
jgi:hypothetical protein